jgi:histidinol-phosphate phosphatase family protein
VTSPVVFLDKDGTLIENVAMNVEPTKIRLTPGADRALARLGHAGFRIAVVTNQAGVAFGRFPESALSGVEERLRTLLAACGVPLAAFEYCPHHPDATVARYRVSCACRKPAPGLVERAARSLGADRCRSWLVGDILDDVEAAHRAGFRAVLFDSGGETEWRLTPARIPDAIVTKLDDAVDVILTAPGFAER